MTALARPAAVPSGLSRNCSQMARGQKLPDGVAGRGFQGDSRPARGLGVSAGQEPPFSMWPARASAEPMGHTSNTQWLPRVRAARPRSHVDRSTQGQVEDDHPGGQPNPWSLGVSALTEPAAK